MVGYPHRLAAEAQLVCPGDLGDDLANRKVTPIEISQVVGPDAEAVGNRDDQLRRRI